MLDLPRSFWEFSRSVEEVTDRHEVRVCDDLAVIDDSEWNGLVERCPEGTIFHRHEWLRAVESAFDYRPCHVTARKDGNLVGVLPQFEMALPKVPLRQVRSVVPGFGGPVVGSDYGKVLRGLLSKSADLCGGQRVLHELRACNPEVLRYNDQLQRRGYRPARFKGRSVLDIDRPYEAVREGMS